jgi:N-acetyl-beta-hexosaminidase
MESFSGGTELLPWIIGAEATIWSESIDEHNLDSRIFPRISALAERLWSSTSKFKYVLWKI